jgi:hypothetical protein
MILTAQKTANASSLNFGRIAKPLRGGGGGAPGAASSGGYSSANPLARLQGEDSGTAGAYEVHSVFVHCAPYSTSVCACVD